MLVKGADPHLVNGNHLLVEKKHYSSAFRLHSYARVDLCVYDVALNWCNKQKYTEHAHHESAPHNFYCIAGDTV